MRNALAVGILGVCLCYGALPPSVCANYASWDTRFGRIATSVCAGIWRSRDCASAIETYQANRNEGHFKRVGRTLTIMLEEGKTVSFTNPREEDGPRFYYIEFIPIIGQHVVNIQYYEGDSFCLVDAKTGNKTGICGRPLPSPRGDAFACFVTDAENGNSIEIWRVTSSRLHREWLLEPTEWLPGRIIWLSDQTIRVDVDDEHGRTVGHKIFTQSHKTWIQSR